MARTHWNWLLIGLSLTACNALDKDERLPPGPHLVVPTDNRPAVQALSLPPPIIGGTLAVSPDGENAVVADPERDRVSIVELGSRAVHEITLEAGVEPGRVIVDRDNRAHIALRRAGEVLTVSVPDGTVIARRHACAAPRGLAYDEASDRIQVACASGELVAMRADGSAGAQSHVVADDLRDVISVNGQLTVTRFKSAQLLKVSSDLAQVTSMSLPNVTRDIPRTVTSTFREADGSLSTSGELVSELHDMQPQVAWRTVASANGSVWMLHQVESNNEIEVKDEPSADSSPYGGSSFSCSGIVQTALTRVDGDRVVDTTSVGGMVLAVDMAINPTGSALAIAQAGQPDQGSPRPTVEFIDEDGETSGGTGPAVAVSPNSSVMIVRTPSATGVGGCTFAETVPVDGQGQATSVAYVSDNQLLVQLREPAALAIVDDPQLGGQRRFSAGIIALGGESTFDTGHELFHRDSGAGIACAGCHAEGGDDGHVWHFSTVGARRTQAVNVGLGGTLPLHWDGDMKDLSMIMDKVFVGRMGGVHQSKQRLEVLENWVFGLRPPPAMIAADDAAAMRGKELFESGEVGCAGCHNGDALTNNHNYDVGTEPGHELQVPSLHGVAYRAPFIHTGCAPTLADRFDPSCGGGDQHGHTSQLSSDQLDDLVAYLKTL